jgi:hypothetical protein
MIDESSASWGLLVREHGFRHAPEEVHHDMHLSSELRCDQAVRAQRPCGDDIVVWNELSVKKIRS